MTTGLHSLQARSSYEHVREGQGAMRTIGIVGLVDVCFIHLLNLPGTIHETPYIGWLTIAPIVGSVLAAAMLVHRPNPAAWTLAGAGAAFTIIAFVISRTVGLPKATGDIGNWTEPLGLASLLVEGVVVCTAAWAIWLFPPGRTGSSARGVRRPHHRREPRHRAVRPSAAARSRGVGVRGAGLVHRRVVYRHTDRSVRTDRPRQQRGSAPCAMTQRRCVGGSDSFVVSALWLFSRAIGRR